jgi:hypothetical protein
MKLHTAVLALCDLMLSAAACQGACAACQSAAAAPGRSHGGHCVLTHGRQSRSAQQCGVLQPARVRIQAGQLCRPCAESPLQPGLACACGHRAGRAASCSSGNARTFPIPSHTPAAPAIETMLKQTMRSTGLRFRLRSLTCNHEPLFLRFAGSGRG